MEKPISLSTLISLNTDVLSGIGDFLDLQTLYKFSLTCKTANTAACRVPLRIVLVRDTLPLLSKLEISDDPLEALENAPELIKLVSGFATDVAVSPKSTTKIVGPEKIVSKLKLQALKEVLRIYKQALEPSVFKSFVNFMFSVAFQANNIAAVKLLVRQKLPRSEDQADSDNNRCISRNAAEDKIVEATQKSQIKMLPILVRFLGYGRVDPELLQDCAKTALEKNNIPVYATLLALICRCQPNVAAVNEFIRSSLHACATEGFTELCMELVKMFQLRVRFKKLRISEDRSKQHERLNSSTFHDVDEDEVNERLEDEENDFTAALRVFRTCLKGVLDTACRNSHVDLVRALLESKVAGEADEEILNEFFKTAVGKLDENTVNWLMNGRRVSLRTVCACFVNCARRNASESMKMLLRTGKIPSPTITIAIKETLNRGFTDMHNYLKEHLESI